MKFIWHNWHWFLWCIVVLLVVLPPKWDPAVRLKERNEKTAKRLRRKHNERK